MPEELTYEDLSYKTIGALYSVSNAIGGRYNKKVIQKAIAQELTNLNIKYQSDVCADIKYQEQNIGRYSLDFIIENQIVLEIKRGRQLLPNDFNQLKVYLKTSTLKLGILALFTSSHVTFAKVSNIN
ncbi:MAG: GxxExxY protein [Candidatus Falkowbacteria bacterium]